MIEQNELDLLMDLVKLVKKYGPDTFESLSESIRSKEMAERLSSILVGVARATSKVRGARRETISAGKRPSPPKSLTDLKSTDPEKSDLLTKAYDNLLSGNLLPTIRDVRDFARQYGLSEIRGHTRKDSINALIKSLTELPIDQLRSIVQSMSAYGSKGRSFRDLAEVIMGKELEPEE